MSIVKTLYYKKIVGKKIFCLLNYFLNCIICRKQFRKTFLLKHFRKCYRLMNKDWLIGTKFLDLLNVTLTKTVSGKKKNTWLPILFYEIVKNVNVNPIP